MEIKATNTATLNSKTVHKLQDLLIKFEHNLFKAIISAKVSNETFVINSKAGSLQISSKLNLQIGDELTLNVKLDKASQTLSLNISKIERPVVKTQNLQTLNATPITISHKNDIKQLPHTQEHFVAKIISIDKKHIYLQDLKGQNFSVTKANLSHLSSNFQKGEHAIIKWTSPEKAEIRPIVKEHLLHQVQRQLLPQQTSNQQTHQRLTQAAFKLFQAINNEIISKNNASTTSAASVHAKPTERQAPLAILKAQQTHSTVKENIDVKLGNLKEAIKPSPSVAPQVSKPSNSNNVIIKHTQDTIETIKIDLQRLLTTHKITPNLLKSETILKLLTDLNIISKSILHDSSNKTFIHKLSLITQSIDLVLNASDDMKKGAKQNSNDELLSELLKTTLKDAKQTIELTIHKMLFQTASSKLNQEINSSLLINTQIPFEIDKKTKDIALKIKQHKNDSHDKEDTWEIHLSLEMGLLGLISTKIILKDSLDVSVTFWAELYKTKQLIDEKKNVFHRQMTKAGFNLSHINIFLGKKIDEVPPIQISDKQFIDINV